MKSKPKQNQSSRIFKSRFQPVFKSDGKSSALTFLGDKAIGVYLIKRGDKIIYVGYSGSNLQKACLRHFYYYNDTSRQARTYYRDRSDITVRVVLVNTPARALRLEKALIIKYYDTIDNPDKKNYKGLGSKSMEQLVDEYEEALVVKNEVIHEEAPF